MEFILFTYRAYDLFVDRGKRDMCIYRERDNMLCRDNSSLCAVVLLLP